MRYSIKRFQKMRDDEKPIPMMTAYDYTSAYAVEKAGVQIILVGDSLGQVVLGHDSTVPVTMDDMIRHIQMVVRSTQKAHIVGDLPFMSYQVSNEDAIRNAGRLLKEGGCQSVKLEGGLSVAKTVKKIVQVGIPVMGHLGLTPQSVNQIGGYRVQGRSSRESETLLEDALEIQEAGAYAVVLELVSAEVAEMITEKLSVPVIGIGSGVGCSGQVQVFHDILGLIPNFSPKHARRYAEVGTTIENAVESYVSDVMDRRFPSPEESF